MNDLTKKLLKTGLKVVKEVSPFVLCETIYRKAFYHHTYSDPISLFYITDFPNLKRERVTIKRDNETIVGYYYSYDFNKEYKNIVIFAHGYGNGHHHYLDIIDYLCKNDLLVFAYDNTAFDESSGNGMRGFPEGIMNLEAVIKFIKKRFKEKDIVLMGHSWGGYSVLNTSKLFPDIRKVISLSGFNKSSEIVRAHGEEYAEEKTNEFMPYVEEYEKFVFGKYASMEALDAFKKSKAHYYIVHSSDDQTVPISVGLDLFKEKHPLNLRFKFVRYHNKGHGTVYFSDEAISYYNNIKQEYKKVTRKATYEEKEEWIRNNIDRNIWRNMLNTKLMDDIVKFIK